MPFAFGAGDADAGHAREQKRCSSDADDEERRHPASSAATIGPTYGPRNRPSAEPGERVERGVHAEHQELALREVDHAHDAEDEPEARRTSAP